MDAPFFENHLVFVLALKKIFYLCLIIIFTETPPKNRLPVSQTNQSTILSNPQPVGCCRCRFPGELLEAPGVTRNEPRLINTSAGELFSKSDPSAHRAASPANSGDAAHPEKQTLSSWEHVIERSSRIERRLSAADIKITPLCLELSNISAQKYCIPLHKWAPHKWCG